MAEPSQEELKRRCDFLYDDPKYKFPKSDKPESEQVKYSADLRSFERGDKVCVKLQLKDGSDLYQLWDYIDSINVKKVYDLKTKLLTAEALTETDKNKPMLDKVKKLYRKFPAKPLSTEQMIEFNKGETIPMTQYLLRHPRYKNEEIMDFTFVGTYNPAAGGKNKTRKARKRRSKTRRA